MWKVLLYVKGNQGRRETYYSLDEAVAPAFQVKSRLAVSSLGEIAVQYKRRVAYHKRREPKKPGSSHKPWKLVPGETYWTGTRRFLISQTASPMAAAGSQKLDVKDMGTPLAVADFIS